MTDGPTISPEYAAELGRQVDELEAENAALRNEIERLQDEVEYWKSKAFKGAD